MAIFALKRSPDGTITPFNPPDAGTVPGSYQGTYPAIFAGINPAGASVGEYLDSSYVWHSYLRDPTGYFTEFDPTDVQGSGTLGINPAGEIAGWYFDTTPAFHGYVRAPDGTITKFDAPGAGTGQYQGTNACWIIVCFGGINPAGTVAGFYVDDNNVYHGYVRTPEGEFSTFEAPGAGKGAWQGTQPAAINPEGAITGYYTDKKNAVHGFVRLATP